MHLVCFGDSICYGYGARPGEGWVAQMTRMLATLREPVAVTNAGVSGDTTEDGLRRMQWDVERHHPNAVFVQFGLNDASFWYTSVGRPLVGFRTYLANMGEIIQRSFRSGAHTVFLATNHRPAEAPDIPGAELYRRTVREYNEGLRATFSGMKGIVLIDMERLILDHFPNPDTILSPDGVHLNRTGNDFYFMAIGRRIARSLAG